MIDALALDLEQTESGIHELARNPALGRRLDMVPIYDLEHTDLSAYRGLLVGLHADQRYLASRRRQIEAFLALGRVVVVCGHIGHPFLAELNPFVPIPDYRVNDLVVNREAKHPVWKGIPVADLYMRKGVAGFYGRGCNPPPPGATVIHSLGAARIPVDFECRPAVGGWLLVHAGADLWNFTAQDAGADTMLTQLLDWIVSTTDEAGT